MKNKMVKGNLNNKIWNESEMIGEKGDSLNVKDVKDHLQKFKRYLQRQNFTGSKGYLKKNILTQFDEEFGNELTGGSS